MIRHFEPSSIDRNELFVCIYILFLYAIKLPTNSASFQGNSNSIFSFPRLKEEEVEEVKVAHAFVQGKKKLKFDFDNGSSRTNEISRGNSLN